MRRLPVESSDIVAIGYDPKTSMLEIEFKEGRVYQYFDVAPDVYERFMRTDSYGEFFFAHITKQYRYTRVNTVHTVQPTALAFVTGNTRKVRDLQVACAPYDIEVEQLNLPIDEIQSHDPAYIALHKAKQAYKLAGRPVVVQDAFWNILALRGFPGAYMSYVTQWLKPEDFLALMQGKTDRTICCTDTLVYYDGKRSQAFSQDLWGAIANEPRGQGLAIMQIVVFNGYAQTIAEQAAQGLLSTAIKEVIWDDFAKWYSLRQRLAKHKK